MARSAARNPPEKRKMTNNNKKATHPNMTSATVHCSAGVCMGIPGGVGLVKLTAVVGMVVEAIVVVVVIGVTVVVVLFMIQVCL